MTVRSTLRPPVAAKQPYRITVTIVASFTRDELRKARTLARTATPGSVRIESLTRSAK